MILKETNFGFMPLAIVEGFNNSKNHRLLVIYSNGNGLQFEELADLERNYYLIKKAIEQDFYKETGNDFAIMNYDGFIVYQSSGSSVRVRKNDGYIYLNEDEFVIHSHNGGYSVGRTKEEVDANYIESLSKYLFNQDESFDPDHGFCEKRIKF